jgi:putative endonuclease
MPGYVYILKSLKDGALYTGSTTDLKHRLKEHLTGRVPSTKQRHPLKLVYYEYCLSEHDARIREKYLKSGHGKKYLRSRLKNSFVDLERAE